MPPPLNPFYCLPLPCIYQWIIVKTFNKLWGWIDFLQGRMSKTFRTMQIVFVTFLCFIGHSRSALTQSHVPFWLLTDNLMCTNSFLHLGSFQLLKPILRTFYLSSLSLITSLITLPFLSNYFLRKHFPSPTQIVIIGLATRNDHNTFISL